MSMKIKKIAVLGSGVMGSGIACHFANAGFEVLLLDIIPFGLSEAEKTNPASRNKIVNDSLQKVMKSAPDPLYKKSYASRIHTGNFDDNLFQIADCEWIIEVVIEDLKIKKELYDRVEKFRKPGTYITTNTSGIPIRLLTKDRSEDFRKHFLGTHFFNPPRYLRLLELIPGPETDPAVVEFFMDFGREFLGKQSVHCKDTPAFIGNRVGIFSIARLLELTDEFGFDIETVDALTGPVIGRPGTGTFRLQDLVGIDTGLKVMKGVIEHCPEDEYFSVYGQKPLPAYFDFLMENKFLGNKTGQGFYQKTKEKDAEGKSIILALDIRSNQYKAGQKVRMDAIKTAKKLDTLTMKVRSFFEGDDEACRFIQKYFLGLFAYVSKRIPEISDDVFSVDDAMKNGYAWDAGPFEYWDMIGVEKAVLLAEKQGLVIAPWVKDMLVKGITSFYTFENGKRHYYNVASKKYEVLPGAEKNIQLAAFKNSLVYKNTEAQILDIGDGVLCLEFISKSNVIGEGTGEAMNKAIDIAESEGWKGLVIGNNAPNFSVGANLMLVAMHSFQKDWNKINELVAGFQDVNMRLRYSSVPVVIATQGYVFGGGVEMSMHADSVMAAAESYIGLVEAGVGLLPGGGGTKEFAVRLSETFYEGDVQMPKLAEMFKTIAMAQVATSAPMAFDMMYLLPHRDKVVLNTAYVLYEAKQQVLRLSKNYIPPVPKQVKVLGRAGLATLYTAINEFKLGQFISGHDALIATKTAWVMCGGDLTGAQNVTEQYLLDIEREAFISLCGEEKTLERIQYMLQFNKPLRN
jgi:3-hydroxyacyl-CoA dehydrogenase